MKFFQSMIFSTPTTVHKKEEMSPLDGYKGWGYHQHPPQNIFLPFLDVSDNTKIFKTSLTSLAACEWGQ